MSSYRLPVPNARGKDALPGQRTRPASSTLPDSFFRRNIEWFCKLRWFVTAVLALVGGLGACQGSLDALGLKFQGAPLLIAAGVLTVFNLAFLVHARTVPPRSPRRRLHLLINVWSQIVVDLLVLTVVVQTLGGAATSFFFAYLFHVVLACMFFSRPESLAVTLLACGLYGVTLCLETAGVLSRHAILPAALGPPPVVFSPLSPTAINALSAPVIWIVVWYLTSRLSAMVRERERELAQSNLRLIEMQHEKTQHMLRTTHELKAPFAAIQANTQLLLKGHCGPLPDEAKRIVDRIASRCRRLTHEIQEMLQLANLKTSADRPAASRDLALDEIIARSARILQPLADERRVQVVSQLLPLRVRGVEDHCRMLFGNLLANAIVYSHDGGTVHVVCSADEGRSIRVAIEDHGIGISPEKLPRIFEEYYRTEEAVRHNKESTGLGLAIVRHIAEMHGIGIEVTSELGSGTRFVVEFPDDALAETQDRKEQ